MIDLLVDHPVTLLFVVLAGGAALGAVKVKGVSLGPAGALFAGLALSAIDERLAVPEVIGSVGLALFTYGIGLSSGPQFFSSFRAQARTLGVVSLCLVIAAAAVQLLGTLFSISQGTAAGLFAGSLTNTPALAAARDALDGSTEPVVGYSMAYPVGVIGMILAAGWALRRAREAPNADDLDVPLTLGSRTIRVGPGPHPRLRELGATAAVFARVERDGEQLVPGPDFEVRDGDFVSVTAPLGVLDEVTARLGHSVVSQLSHDRSRLDMRRIVVSARQITGRRLGDLELHHRFGAVATRVRRGDVDLLAHDDLTLQPGDRVRVVAPREHMVEIGRLLGDSERRVGEFDALGYTFGLAIGTLLGLVEVPLGGGASFALGIAGGPLVVGLVLGRLERTGPITWQPPFGVGMSIRQLGTILFLGTVGSRSGSALLDALSSRQGIKLAAAAVLVVALTATVFVFSCRHLLGLGGARLAGAIAGLETQPAVLAFANEQADDDRVNTAYALVFPVAMLLKIVLAQLLALA
jgi:putative transport protein